MGAGRWRTTYARDAFIEAFSQAFDYPDWMTGITIHERPYSGPNPVATIHCIRRDGTPDDAAIKVLPRPDAIHDFWDAHPDAEVVAVCIQSFDTAEKIRRLVFEEIEAHL